MAAIVSVTDGVDDILATHLNQYAQTFNNLFGVTDSAQANLGKLPLPWLTVDPAPANGLMWMRSDLGANGQLKIRHNGVTVTYLPVRQKLSATQSTTLFLSTSGWSDLPGCSVSWTFGGGDLYIGLMNGNGVAYNNTGSTPIIGVTLGIQINNLSMLPNWFSQEQLSGANLQIIMTFATPGLYWHIPTALLIANGLVIGNTYTVKANGIANANPSLGQAYVQQSELVVLEV